MASVNQKLLLYKFANKVDKASRVFRKSCVVTSKTGSQATLLFNRPRFFNCIDDTVINSTAAFLGDLIDDKDVKLLSIGSINTGKKNPTFSTGADLIKGYNIIRTKQLSDFIENSDRVYLINFYRTQHFLHQLSKRINTLALQDGITMGSAVLFGLNSRFSVVTERTTWAVPEVTIGSLPDVGTLYHLNKLPNGWGRFLALTGTRLKGQDITNFGLASHFCKSDLLCHLKKEIQECDPGDRDQVLGILDKYNNISSVDRNKSLDKIEEIKTKSQIHFDSSDVFQIIESLKAEDGEGWCTHQLALIGRACPLSVRVTVRLLDELSNCSYEQALLKTYKVAGNLYFCKEMKRGIEAALLCPGKPRPKWNIKELNNVPDDLISEVFLKEFKENILTLEQISDRNTQNAY